jgi:uncharacterized protein (TIGR00299 family) protein
VVIKRIIDSSDLEPGVKNLSYKIFKRLGEAEAKVHQCALEEVHFHEVGAVDTIIDIVGAAICINHFGIEKVYASPLHTGSGMVQCAHGLMPVPAPATAELLKGATFYSSDIRGELVTPTGAAIITTLTREFGPLPPFQVDTVAYGAGTWDLKIPNVLRLFLGRSEEKELKREPATIIETNIDDMNPQVYSHLMERLYQAGAADVFLTPVYMKKNRPGTLLTVVSTLANYQPLVEIIFSETTTLGVRTYQVERHTLDRSFETIQTKNGPVRLKIAWEGGKIRNISPEYEDCLQIALKTGLPLKEIVQEALHQARFTIRQKRRAETS